ncbi:MAG: hypothetical protein R2777_05735 [Chitinophagales bacterium]
MTFLSSCDPSGDSDVTPLLTVTPSESGNVVEGTVVTVEVSAGQNPSSKKDLKTLVITKPGTDTTITINAATYAGTFTFVAPLAPQSDTYTFTLTDKADEVATKSFSLTGTSGTTTTPLGSATPFTWQRVGGSAGTGLSQFGLSWTSNTSTSAIIADAADKLVVLSSSQWSSLTTQEDLQAAIDAGTGVAQYTGVSSQQNGTYDDVLGTKNGSNYYLIHVTSGQVSTSGSGTTITITGNYKE